MSAYSHTEGWSICAAVVQGKPTLPLIKIKFASEKHITSTIVCFLIADRWNLHWSKKWFCHLITHQLKGTLLTTHLIDGDDCRWAPFQKLHNVLHHLDTKARRDNKHFCKCVALYRIISWVGISLLILKERRAKEGTVNELNTRAAQRGFTREHRSLLQTCQCSQAWHLSLTHAWRGPEYTLFELFPGVGLYI